MASNHSAQELPGSPRSEASLESPARSQNAKSEQWRNPRGARNAFLWPTLIVVLALAVFPLIASLGMALSYFTFAPGGFSIRWAGTANFADLFSGSEALVFIGHFGSATPAVWLTLILGSGVLIYAWLRAVRGGVRPIGLLLRALAGAFGFGFLWLFAWTVFGDGGFPGSLVTTVIYAVVGTSVEYTIGLGLAWLTSRRLAGQRLFRVVYLLPLTITPVGVAYMFRLLNDTARGPFEPFFTLLGLGGFSLMANPWGARLSVIIADVWEWTPFMYIVLLAALEGRDLETEEAAIVDGASRWQIFRYVTLPVLVPASATVIFIRLIEAFKIIDLPNILTNGGPGTATVSTTLESFLSWRGFNLGLSAAVAYALLLFVTIVSISYVTLVLRRAQGTT